MVSQPLATLVTLGASGLFASHIPMIFEDDGSEFGLLKGHISAVTRSGMTSCQPWMRSPFLRPSTLHLAELYPGKSSTQGGADLELRRGTRLWPPQGDRG